MSKKYTVNKAACLCQPIIWSTAAMLRDSVAVVHTRPRVMPLPMITMRKSIHGFLFPYMIMGLRLIRNSGTLETGQKF